MNTRALLDQLLKAGQQAVQQKTSSTGGLGGLLQGIAGKGDVSTLLKGAGGGALAAGALGALLGNKSARKIGGKALTYGGLAALGVIAYKAYGSWQAQQRTQTAQPVREPQTLDRLPPAEAEVHSQAILQALVAAAKADGHVDAQERQLIEQHIGQMDSDPELLLWLDAELHKPLDPAEVARAASTPEMAAEMYLASVLVVDEESFMERAYLEELARQLGLEPGLKAELDAQVRQQLLS